MTGHGEHVLAAVVVVVGTVAVEQHKEVVVNLHSMVAVLGRPVGHTHQEMNLREDEECMGQPA